MIACESPSLLWQAEIHESTTAVLALLSMTQRRTEPSDWPWTYVRSRIRLFAVVAALYWAVELSPNRTIVFIAAPDVVPISTPVKRQWCALMSVVSVE